VTTIKRKALAFILIIVIALSVASWLVYNQTINQVENQIYNVKITDFKWTSNWEKGPVGLMWGGPFNVTLHNLGKMDIEGLTVKVKLSANNSEIGSETYFDGYNTNVTFGLHAGEIREFEGVFMSTLDKLTEAQGEQTFSVICMLNSTILDELTLPSN
jgi:hypothetical protein